MCLLMGGSFLKNGEIEKAKYRDLAPALSRGRADYLGSSHALAASACSGSRASSAPMRDRAADWSERSARASARLAGEICHEMYGCAWAISRRASSRAAAMAWA